jgi:hypothetical protein
MKMNGGDVGLIDARLVDCILGTAADLALDKFSLQKSEAIRGINPLLVNAYPHHD